MRQLQSSGEGILSCALCLAVLGPANGFAQAPSGRAGSATSPALPAAPAPSSGDSVLTLADAQAEATRSNRRVRAAEEEVRRQQSQWKAARAERFPRVELGAIGSDQAYRSGGGARSLGTIPGLGVGPIFQDLDERFNAFMGISISQPVLGLYTINLKGRLQHVDVETARERLSQSLQETLSSVSRAYYELLALQSALEANQEAIRYYRETARMVSSQVREQTALRPALLAVQAQLAAQEQRAVELRNGLENGEEQINLLLGRDVRTRFRVVAPPDVEPGTSDLGALQDEALRRRPELRQASLDVSKAELSRRLAKAQYRPDLNVGVTYLRSFSGDIIPDDSVSLGFAFRMEILDWGRRRNQVQASERAIEEAKIGLSESRDRVLVDVSAQYRSLLNARARIRAAEAAQIAAREQVKTGLAQ